MLSLALFLRQTARPFVGVGAPDPASLGRTFRQAAANGLPECPQLMVSRLDGPLYFGSVGFIRREFRRFEIERPGQKHILFILKGVGEIDLPGADLLVEEADRRARRGGSLHVQIKTPGTRLKLSNWNLARQIGAANLHESKFDAIRQIVPTLDPEICAGCELRIFNECRKGRQG